MTPNHRCTQHTLTTGRVIWQGLTYAGRLMQQWWHPLAYRDSTREPLPDSGDSLNYYLLFVCRWFTSSQHLMSYQGGYWFVTVCPHGDVIVRTNWETRLPAPWPNNLLSHIILTCANQSLPCSNNADRLARKWQVYLFMSLVWLHHGTDQIAMSHWESCWRN